jgi:hypothetical protein
MKEASVLEEFRDGAGTIILPSGWSELAGKGYSKRGEGSKGVPTIEEGE